MTQRRRGFAARGLLTIAIVMLGLGGALLSLAPVAGAQAATVTAYDAYPPPLPTGCPDGAGALEGVEWSNGRGGSETDLRRLAVGGGDTLTLSWSSYAPGCLASDGSAAVAVSLAVYDAITAEFDPSVNQRLLTSTTCGGPDGAACAATGGRYALSLVIPAPSPELSCNYQAGGVLGLPLAVVGPAGSYYSQALRGDDRPTMLIGATNFTLTGCEAAVSPTSVVAPTTSVTAEVSPTSVVSPTTQAPTTTEAPGAEVEAAVVSRAPAGALPVTGPRHTGSRTAMGVSLVAAGGLALLAARRLRRSVGRQPA